jgi:hypothetical protein
MVTSLNCSIFCSLRKYQCCKVWSRCKESMLASHRNSMHTTASSPHSLHCPYHMLELSYTPTLHMITCCKAHPTPTQQCSGTLQPLYTLHSHHQHTGTTRVNTTLNHHHDMLEIGPTGTEFICMPPQSGKAIDY